MLWFYHVWITVTGCSSVPTSLTLNAFNESKTGRLSWFCRATKYDHATPCLRELPWLPVSERVTFKILVTVFKCLSGTAPGYLSSCLSLHKPRRANLRSASDTTQSTIRTLQSASNRTFIYVAPSLWNNLPIPMRTCDSLQVFKKSVKTYLYPNVV